MARSFSIKTAAQLMFRHVSGSAARTSHGESVNFIRRRLHLRLGTFIAVLATTTVVAAEDHVINFSCPTFGCSTIRGHLVTDNTAHPRSVAGEFWLDSSPRKGIGLSSTDGFGGACVLFRDPARGVCLADNGCKLPDGLRRGPPDFSEGACIAGECWLRVSIDHCWIAWLQDPQVPMQMSHERATPRVNLNQVRRKLYPHADYPNVDLEARLSACLNSKFDPNEGPPCGEGPGDYVQSFTEPETLKY